MKTMPAVRSADFLLRGRLGSSVRVLAFGALFAALTTMSPEWESGKRNETLARVENERVSTGYFLHRYENFLLSGASKDSWRVRRQFLDNMLNERLIIRQVYDEGITGDREFQDKLRAVTTQALLDGYRRKAVIDNVTVTEDELKRAFARSNTRVRARHLYASTEPEARELYELVMAGATFDSLARLTFADSDLASNGGDLGYFTWGDMDPAFEEAAYNLPVGGVSPPVKTDGGYSVIKVEDRITVPLRTEYEYLAKKPRLQRALRGIKIVDQGQQFARDLAASLDIKFSPKTLSRLFSLWTPKGASPPQDIANSLNMMADVELLRYGGGSWSVRDLADRIQLTSERQRRRVKTEGDLAEFLRGLVVRDVMVDRARGEGVDDDPGVQNEIRARIDQYLIERWRERVTKTLELFVDAVSPDASVLRLASAEDVPNPLVRARYEQYRANYLHPAELNVREILVRTRPEAEELLKEVRLGASFSGLARTHSLRRSSAAHGGKTGYRSAADFGGAGTRLTTAKEGELIGPLSVDAYYAVYQVIGRRPPRQKTFEEAEAQVKRELVIEAKFRAYGKLVETLRAGRDVAVDEDLLRTLSIP